MATASRQLRRLQIGPETTPGTAVAATFKLVGDGDVTYELDREFEDFPRQVFAPLTNGGIDLRAGTLINWQGNLTFEEIAHILANVLATPSTTGGDEEPYTHTFERTWNVPPTLTTYTAELTEHDGSSAHVQKESAYVTGSSVEIAIARNSIATVRWQAFGRKGSATTETASLAAISGRTPISGNLFKLYMDDSWAELGSTQQSSVIRAASLTYNNGALPKFTLDGRAAQDKVGDDFNQASGTLSVTYELDSVAASEIAHFEAGDLRFVRLAAEMGDKSIALDWCGVHRSVPSYSEEDGLRLVTFELGLEYDPVGASAFAAEVVNELADLDDV